MSNAEVESDSPVSTMPSRATHIHTGVSKASTDTSPAEAKERVVRARRSVISSYNESILSGTARRRHTIHAGNRTISGETLVDDGTSGQILGDSIKALDLEWDVNSPRRASTQTKTAEAQTEAVKRRRSVRLEALDGAKDKLARQLTVLGKRGRDAVELGKKTAHDVAKGLQRRASLRPRLAEDDDQSVDTHVDKKLRHSYSAESKDSASAVTDLEKTRVRPKIKRWLSQGLYVGQDRSFNPRFKESRNKARAASSSQAVGKERTLLPLPMFLGERLLDVGRDFKMPFDVFAPLPPGQPKPEEWRKTRKSKCLNLSPQSSLPTEAFSNFSADMFVGDAASFWRDNQPPEVSRCICTPESKCDETCQNRFMFYECDDTNCNIGAELCTNRSFEGLRQRYKSGGKYNVGVEVMKTEDRGYGVRSNRTFEPHQIIVEYAGEIITQEECDRRMNTFYKNNDVGVDSRPSFQFIS